MFNKCHKLKEIKGISKFNTINCTNMRGMFQECNELLDLDLSNFNTSKVNDISFIFNKCHKLKKIKGINKFYTLNCTNMKGMLLECNKLLDVDLSNFIYSKVN